MVNKLTIVVSGLLTGLLLLSAGCGVKAPPVPPDMNPPVIAVFTHTLGNGSLSLSWHLSEGSPIPQSYTVYRSQASMADKSCQKCPLVFRRLMTVPADGGKSGTQTIAVDPGYRYVFKMTAIDANGIEGPFSQTIQFIY